MDSRFEEMKAALKKLHQDLERFWAQPDVNTVPDMIDRFLGTRPAD